MSPALSELSKKLNLSQSLAGVTLLAFGNGAPDVLASISASSSGSSTGGLYLAVSSLLGSQIFVICVVSSCVIFKSPSKIKIKPYYFLRDTIFYLIALSLVLSQAILRGYIDTQGSLSFLGLYALYVTFVILQTKYIDSKEKAATGKEGNYFEMKDQASFSTAPEVSLDEEDALFNLLNPDQPAVKMYGQI
jgi:sodium/potassium/calcium exchanger 6